MRGRGVAGALAQVVMVAEGARRQEVDRSLVYRWRRELGVTRLTTPPKLLAVEVAEDAPAADPLPCGAKAAAGDSRIEIELPEGIRVRRSEEHTSELQSLMRISYAVFCLKKKNENYDTNRSTR